MVKTFVIVLQAQTPLKKHKMRQGWKVEVLHPRKPSDIVPGTVTKVQPLLGSVHTIREARSKTNWTQKIPL